MKDKHHLKLVKKENIVVEGNLLKNNTFLMALDTLMRNPFEADVAYQLSKLVRRLQTISNSFDAEGKAIIANYCKKDEKGQPKFITEKQLKKVKDKDGKEEEKEVEVAIGWDWLGDTKEEQKTTEDKLEEETKTLYYRKYPIDVYKFNRGEFLGARLTLSQWYALAPILSNPVDANEDHSHLNVSDPSKDQAPTSSEVPGSPAS